MNHAFLIEAHDSPELLQRIVARLAAPNHYFFIHLDKSSHVKKIETNHIRGGYIGDNQRVSVVYPGYSMIEAELVLLKEAYNYPVHMDYFHLISGHDYPCRGNDEFDNFFESCPKGRSFMHYDNDEEHAEWNERILNRYNKWHLLEVIKNRYARKVAEKILNTLFVRKNKFCLYAGWNWFSWHRSCVKYVLDYLKTHPNYLKRFRYTVCCDEVIFHTMLYNDLERLNIDKDNALRYVDWRPKREYTTLPLILDERDYSSIINSGKLFCRKVFIDKSHNLLDKLDEHI